MSNMTPIAAVAPASRLLFLDIEASGLHPTSVPVEIGWAWLEPEGDRVRIHAEARLIRPLPAWLEDKSIWDPAAERIHGITREELLHSGLVPAEVVSVFDRARAARVLVCDTGRDGLDRQWLRRLYQAAQRPRMPAIAEAIPCDFAGVLARDACLGPDTMEAVFEIAPQISHRAAEDAAHWAWIVAALATLADIAALGRREEVAALGRAPRDVIELLGDRMPIAPDEVQYRPMPGL